MRRNLLITMAAASVGLLLGGCSLLAPPGAPRDSAGHVTESTTISARDLEDGDCFTFNSADGGIVDEVTVMPCLLNHEYLVLAQGSLTTADVSTAGSLQNAVSAACSDVFDTFKAGVKGHLRPKQEFLVFPESDEKDSDQLYSCITTDPDQAANASNSPSESPSPSTTPAP